MRYQVISQIETGGCVKMKDPYMGGNFNQRLCGQFSPKDKAFSVIPEVPLDLLNFLIITRSHIFDYIFQYKYKTNQAENCTPNCTPNYNLKILIR